MLGTHSLTSSPCRWVAALSLLAAALGVARPAGAAEPLPIYGGNVTQGCSWPTTVSLGGCTGTLVSPDVVIFAAHCGSIQQVYVGDNAYNPDRVINTTTRKTHPAYNGEGGGRDFAFCKLSEQITDI